MFYLKITCFYLLIFQKKNLQIFGKSSNNFYAHANKICMLHSRMRLVAKVENTNLNNN